MAKKQKAAVSETITENIFRDFYGKKQFIEKSAIPDDYGFVSKNGTNYKGYPDFFRDDDDENFVIIVEAKADNFAVACKEVKFYARTNKIEKDIVAPYSKRKIFDGDLINCYGIKENQGSRHSLVKLSELFDYENGSLQSENNEEGEYNFITASEEWKTHNDFDHECEALVFAVSAGGSLGRCHYVNGKFIASNLCLILTPKGNSEYPINLQFYSLYLNRIRKRLVLDLADGTSKLTISPEDLMDYYVEYVPKTTQDEIVKHYNETVVKAKEQYLKAKCEMNNVLASFV